jgi:hypothetical protein
VTARHVKRLGLLALMALAALNLFTGAPLIAVWVGSRVQGDAGGLTMTAVVTVIGVMAVLSWLLVAALGRLGAAHDTLAGRAADRRRTPWLKPFNEGGARPDGASLRALDKVLVAAVVVAGLAFEIWFLFFAGSSIGH